MNVNANRSQQTGRMEEAPGMRTRTPAEVLAILQPTREEPRAILIGSLWKTGLVPEGAVS